MRNLIAKSYLEIKDNIVLWKHTVNFQSGPKRINFFHNNPHYGEEMKRKLVKLDNGYEGLIRTLVWKWLTNKNAQNDLFK